MDNNIEKGDKRLNIVLCDDNKEQREIIKGHLKEVLKDHEYNIYEFESGEELVANFPSEVSIILLDIQMKKLNGMEVAKWIRTFNKNVEIIFITGLADYIQEGYEVRAYRYLMKPVGFDEIKKHFTAWLNEYSEIEESYLNIAIKHKIERIAISEIKYIEIYGRCLTIYTEKENYNLKMTLEKLEEELCGHKFFRCHKSYLVNMKKIISIKQGVIKLQHQEEVPLSRHKAKELKVELASLLGDLIC